MQDDVFIKRLINNDNEAFSYMIEKYGKLLWVIVGGVLGRIGTVQDIEECISDVYVQIWKNPKAFKPNKGSFKTFLAVIAKSRALDTYRRISKEKTSLINEAFYPADDDLLKYIINREMTQVLYSAIDSLTEPDREIITRRYLFEEKPARIAKNVSLPIKEVENRLYQSKLKLRKIIGEKKV